jgi:di/tricarboxylate transporter
MAATDVTRSTARAPESRRTTGVRRITETKAAFKTTEFISYVVVLVGILIAGAVTKAGGGADDRLLAKHAWLYVTILTVGYMISRGLAKSGVREPYTDDDDR